LFIISFDCRFIKGNIRAKKRIAYLREILKEVGIESERIEMYNIATSDGPKFALVAKEMTEKIRGAGSKPDPKI